MDLEGSKYCPKVPILYHQQYIPTKHLIIITFDFTELKLLSPNQIFIIFSKVSFFPPFTDVKGKTMIQMR